MDKRILTVSEHNYAMVVSNEDLTKIEIFPCDKEGDIYHAPDFGLYNKGGWLWSTSAYEKSIMRALKNKNNIKKIEVE